MSIKNGKELEKVYSKAKSNKYSFIASNVAEPNIAIGLIRGAANKNSDIVLQLSRSACKFAGDGDPIVGLKSMSNYIEQISSKYNIGVFLNMDHLQELDFIEQVVETGIPSSVMIDASDKNFEKNIKISKQAKEICESKNILVEAELGRIKGVEDEISSEIEDYTDPRKAVEFVKKTNCDLLAISIGTKHGVSKGKNIELRKDIAEKVNNKLISNHHETPLVIHGSSGLNNKDLKKLTEMGVVKFNKDTRYQYEYSRTSHDFYVENTDSIVPPEEQENRVDGFFPNTEWSPNKEVFDPRKVSKKVRNRIEEVISKFCEVTGSANRSLYKG